jgi:lysophospholipase L1-like esterase
MKITFLIILASFIMLGTLQSQTAPPFWSDIVAFKKLDSTQPVPPHPILFVGSSSLRMWPNLPDCFPDFPVINRGFGGSCLIDLIRYSYDVILPYQPRQVLIYCGENDLASSDTLTASEVVKRFETLFGMIRLNLPDADIRFISIKPSPVRKHLIPKVSEANRDIRAFLKKQKKAGFIDVYSAMVDSAGNPREELFIDDRLHMNQEGYAIWKRIIKPYLLQ